VELLCPAAISSQKEWMEDCVYSPAWLSSERAEEHPLVQDRISSHRWLKVPITGARST